MPSAEKKPFAGVCQPRQDAAASARLLSQSALAAQVRMTKSRPPLYHESLGEQGEP